jgi:hypothetical protein
MQRERGDDCETGFAGGESGRFESISTLNSFLLQNRRLLPFRCSTRTIFGALRHLCRSFTLNHKLTDPG